MEMTTKKIIDQIKSKIWADYVELREFEGEEYDFCVSFPGEDIQDKVKVRQAFSDVLELDEIESGYSSFLWTSFYYFKIKKQLKLYE